MPWKDLPLYQIYVIAIYEYDALRHKHTPVINLI